MCVTGAWATDYVLDTDSRTSTDKANTITYVVSTLNFSIEESPQAATAGSGSNKTEKFRTGRTYNITVPANLTVTNITFYGYSNDNSKTGYISAINGAAPKRNGENVSNISSEVFPTKSNTYVSYTYDVTKDANNVISFQATGTASNSVNQVCLIITITGTTAAAPGTISFSPAAGSVETGAEITLSSTGATTIYYQWGASSIDGEGDWTSPSTYADNAKPEVPAYGSSNNVLSVKATNTYGSTYGSATYTILAAKKATTTEITAASIAALNTDIKNGTDAGTLAATVTPDGESALASPTITWSSSETGVATIDENTGAITLVGEGTTTITASYAGDEDYSASSDAYDLTVTDTRKSVSLSFSATAINDYNFDGETIAAPTLTAVDGESNPIDLSELTGLTFTERHPDKTAFVTVDSETGAITAANTNNFGTSTVTAAFAGNSNYKAATSKSYTVTRKPSLRQILFDNGFDAFIKEGSKTVSVYYMAGTDAPAQTDDIQVADGFTAAVVGDNVVLTQTATGKVKTYAITKTAVTPFVGTGKQTFDGTETYVASGYGWDNSKKWRFSKTDNDWTREAPGNTRLYFFVGAGTSLTLSESGQNTRAIEVYVNGMKDGSISQIEKNKTIAVTLNGSQPNMVEIRSNQTSGDGGFKDMTIIGSKQAVKIGSHGYSTLISDKILDFEGIDGLTAYRAKRDDKAVTLTAVTEVDANKGIVLEGTASQTYYVPVLASTDSNVDTDLTGNATTAYELVSGKYYYVLSYQNGAEGFYNYNGSAAIPAGKAFFESDTELTAGGGANYLSIIYAEDETDGIASIENGKLNIETPAFNLAGQKVGAEYKGIVIVNGKKYVRK